jgi:putative phosphoribosyl transferase
MITLPLPSFADPSASTISLSAELLTPASPSALIVFSHASGAAHESSRNHLMARQLAEAGMCCLLPELLDDAERRQDALQGRWHKEVGLLERRLDALISWLRSRYPQLSRLSLGLVSASTGAAAAIVRESHHDDVRAVVSRGGLPHFAESVHLSQLPAPTLLIVGSADCGVLLNNRLAMTRMARCRHRRLLVVKGATHLFEEQGAMEAVAAATVLWMQRWLLDRKGGDRAATEVEVDTEAEHSIDDMQGAEKARAESNTEEKKGESKSA